MNDFADTPYDSLGRRSQRSEISDEEFARMPVEDRLLAWQQGRVSPEQEDSLMQSYQAPLRPIAAEEFPEVKSFWDADGKPAIEPGSLAASKPGPQSAMFEVPADFVARWRQANGYREDAEDGAARPPAPVDEPYQPDDDEYAPGVLGR